MNLGREKRLPLPGVPLPGGHARWRVQRLTPPDLTDVRFPRRRPPGPYRDGTKYSRFHPNNYLSHHLASISLAAVYTDAVHIEAGVNGLKQRALALASPDPSDSSDSE